MAVELVTVKGTLLGGDGTPQAGTTVPVDLVIPGGGPAIHIATGGTITGASYKPVTAADGTWSQQVIPPADLDPPDCRWRVRYPDSTIVSPSFAFSALPIDVSGWVPLRNVLGRLKMDATGLAADGNPASGAAATITAAVSFRWTGGSGSGQVVEEGTPVPLIADSSGNLAAFLIRSSEGTPSALYRITFALSNYQIVFSVPDAYTGDAGVWNAGTAYTGGQVVRYPGTDQPYQALANNTGHDPTTSPAYWSPYAGESIVNHIQTVSPPSLQPLDQTNIAADSQFQVGAYASPPVTLRDEIRQIAQTLGGATGTVSYVNVTTPGTALAIGGGPVTRMGTITIDFGSQAANTVAAGPTSGSSATATFRLLVAADIPSLAASKITSGTFSTSLIPSLDASKITSGTFAAGLLPLGSASAFGAVKVDGTTITASGGVISAAGSGGGGGGGSGGGSSTSVTLVGAVTDGKPLIEAAFGSTTQFDDEFADLANQSGPNNGLASKWNKHNLGTSSWLVFDDRTAPGCLYIDLATGQAADQHLYQTAPGGDFTLYARWGNFMTSDRQMWGISILDTSGNGVCLEFDTDIVNPSGLRAVSAWQQTGTFSSFAATGLSTTDEWQRSAVPMSMWLQKAGTTYTAGLWWSPRKRAMPPAAPGLNQALPSLAGQTFTAAYIGFGRIFGTGTARLELEAFRVLNPTIYPDKWFVPAEMPIFRPHTRHLYDPATVKPLV